MPGRRRSKGWCTLWTAGTRMDGKLRSTCSSGVCIVKGYLNRLYLARNILETSKNIELSSTAILLNIAIWVWTPSSQLTVKLNFRLLRRSLSPLPQCKPCLIANQVIFVPQWVKRASTLVEGMGTQTRQLKRLFRFGELFARTGHQDIPRILFVLFSNS